MTLKSIDDAKIFALEATNRYLSKEETLNKLAKFREYKNSSLDNDTTWDEEITNLETWLSSETLNSGKHPSGIDDLVLELIEWRAMTYAIESTSLKNNPFQKHQYHAQWLTGAAYAIICLIGKLLSNHPKDNSLKSLWKRIYPFIVESGICSTDEASVINKLLLENNSNFKTLLLRNKVIAHNESSLTISWSDVDTDIEMIVRIWAIIVGFCSFGIIAPFNTNPVFSGLEGIVSTNELVELNKARDIYIQKAITWSKTNFFTKETQKNSMAFAELSIDIQVFHNNNDKTL